MALTENGRPTDYNQRIADKICGYIAEGRSLRFIAKQPEMPVPGTICRWLSLYPEFKEQYRESREVQEHVLFTDIIEIADKPREGTKTTIKGDKVEKQIGDMVERSRLMIDARKWYLSKLKPRKYGDKLDTDLRFVDGQGNDRSAVTDTRATILKALEGQPDEVRAAVARKLLEMGKPDDEPKS